MANLTKAEIEKVAVDFQHNDNKYEMEEKYSGSTKYDYTEFCDCCGRGIKGEPKFWIQAIEPGEVVPAHITDENIESVGLVSMGMYPIGSECRKKYPKEYIIKE